MKSNPTNVDEFCLSLRQSRIRNLNGPLFSPPVCEKAQPMADPNIDSISILLSSDETTTFDDLTKRLSDAILLIKSSHLPPTRDLIGFTMDIFTQANHFPLRTRQEALELIMNVVTEAIPSFNEENFLAIIDFIWENVSCDASEHFIWVSFYVAYFSLIVNKEVPESVSCYLDDRLLEWMDSFPEDSYANSCNIALSTSFFLGRPQNEERLLKLVRNLLNLIGSDRKEMHTAIISLGSCIKSMGAKLEPIVTHDCLFSIFSKWKSNQSDEVADAFMRLLQDCANSPSDFFRRELLSTVDWGNLDKQWQSASSSIQIEFVKTIEKLSCCGFGEITLTLLDKGIFNSLICLLCDGDYEIKLHVGHSLGKILPEMQNSEVQFLLRFGIIKPLANLMQSVESDEVESILNAFTSIGKAIAAFDRPEMSKYYQRIVEDGVLDGLEGMRGQFDENIDDLIGVTLSYFRQIGEDYDGYLSEDQSRMPSDE